VVNSGKVEDVVEAIMDAYRKWKAGKLEWKVNEEYLKKFCKESLTSEFARIIDFTEKTSSAGNIPYI